MKRGIVSDQTVPIDTLKPYDKNPRTHSPHQIDQIVASIKEFGWTIPILVDEKNLVIAGHGRLMAAKKMGMKEVPIVVARGWTKAQKRAYTIADNQLTLNSDWDLGLLKAEIGDLKLADFDLELLGFDDLQLVQFTAGIGEGESSAGAGEEQDEADRELTDDEDRTLVEAWSVLQDEWSDILRQYEQRGFISTSFTKGALAVYFMRARLYGSAIPSAATLAYTPHRVRVSAGTSGSFQDMMKDRSAIRGLRFLAVNQPRFDKMLGMTLGVNAHRLPGEFPALLARDLIDEFVVRPGGHVLDPCHGWGGRMLGFLLSRNAEHYEGFDVDPKTFRGVKDMFGDLKKFALGKRTSKTHCVPFEDAKLGNALFDFALTSPPYFDVEHYDGELSSWRRYDKFDGWVGGFYRPMIAKVAKALKPGCKFALQIGNKSYPLEETAKLIADDVGLEYLETRATGMINNYNQTKESDGEVVVLLRRKAK